MLYLFIASLFLLGCLSLLLYFRREQRREQQIQKLEIEKRELELQKRELEFQKRELELRVTELQVRLEEEKRHSEEKVKSFHLAEAALKDSFKAISADVLQRQQSSFFDIAKSTFEKYSTDMQSDWQKKEKAISEVVRPLRESLDKVDSKIQDLEKSRISAHASMGEQLRQLSFTQQQLHHDTHRLVNALKMPNARGQWGEVQLRRVVEMAGMVEYCDFIEQPTLTAGEFSLRPDLIVKLPNQRSIVIDAKAPLQAYLEAIEATTEEVKLVKLKEHAKQVKSRLSDLSEKGYWEHLTEAPEFVVLFLPGESFFSSALEHDPQLIEFGAEKRVLLATPTTLIALLKAVALGWREQKVHEHATAICELGRSLHERLLTMSEHFLRLKKSLDGSVDAYNKVVGSFETRVLTAARRFQDMGISAASQELPLLDPIETTTRSLVGIPASS